MSWTITKGMADGEASERELEQEILRIKKSHELQQQILLQQFHQKQQQLAEQHEQQLQQHLKIFWNRQRQFQEIRQREQLEALRKKEKHEESAVASTEVKQKLQDFLRQRRSGNSKIARPENCWAEEMDTVLDPSTTKNDFPLRKTASEPNLLKVRLKQRVMERRNSPMSMSKRFVPLAKKKVLSSCLPPSESPPQEPPKELSPPCEAEEYQRLPLFSSPSMPNISLAAHHVLSPDLSEAAVRAASVNPIDSFMLGGYGRTSFQALRSCEIEFPLILGRDFSGTIISKGHGVNEVYNIGDEVYGFVPIHKQGTFAEFVLASQYHILPKPKHLTHEQSSSLVYATMTAWSGLFLAGNMIFRQTKGLRVLVLGGSGGVGTAAIQLLKSQGCVVYTTCSKDAIPLVTSLGPDVVFDRNDTDFVKNVELEGKYHIILDAGNMGIQNIPSKWNYESYITLNSPLLVNNDKYGLFGGLLTSAGNLLEANVTRMCNGKTVRWGYFVPSNTGFRFINDLICQDKIKPVIQKQFDFKDLPNALQTSKEGHSRGKLVVSYT